MSEKPRDSSFLDMELPVEVWLATEDVPLGRLIDLRPGEILSLSRDPDAAVDLVVNGVTVASGDLVVMEGNFGLRITSTPTQALAGAGTENQS